MPTPAARSSALPSAGALRWPYRVISVDSPTRPLTRSSHAALLHHGIDLHPYSDGPSALLALMAEDPCAVLAPTDLAGVDLLRFVEAIVAWSGVPIIVGLTGEEGSHDRAFRALEAGARGLVGLPVAADQLSSAIRHLGLNHTVSATALSYGPLDLDRAAHQVRVFGTPVHLSPQEFTLLEYLLAEAPRAVPVAELAAVIGREHPADPVGVRKRVQNLRRKLAGARPGHTAVVETLRGVGYRITDG